MNYIKSLQAENAKQAKRIAELREGLETLRFYANSSKFYSERGIDLPSMNPADVVLRVSETLSRDLDIEFGAE